MTPREEAAAAYAVWRMTHPFTNNETHRDAWIAGYRLAAADAVEQRVVGAVRCEQCGHNQQVDIPLAADAVEQPAIAEERRAVVADTLREEFSAHDVDLGDVLAHDMADNLLRRADAVEQPALARAVELLREVVYGGEFRTASFAGRCSDFLAEQP